MYGLHGTDFWGWQSGWRASNVMVGGTYHNGTLIRNDELYHWGAESDTSGGWLAELAGDNFRGFVNPADGNRVTTTMEPLTTVTTDLRKLAELHLTIQKTQTLRTGTSTVISLGILLTTTSSTLL